MNLPNEFRPPEFVVLDEYVAREARISNLRKKLTGLRVAVEKKEQEIIDCEQKIIDYEQEIAILSCLLDEILERWI